MVSGTGLGSGLGTESGKAGWLPLASLAVVVAGMVFGLLLPIYTDEIAWRFHERAWLDNGFDVWMNDVCGPNMVAAAPLFILPGRWFSATMNLLLDDPVWIRVTGVVLGLALVAGFWRLVGQLEPDAERRGLLRTIICALLACGVLPLLLIFSRPEQPVFLAALAMATIALPATARDISARRAWLTCLALVVLTAIGLSYHLKGLLYSVFALSCLAMLAGGTRHVMPRVLAALAIVALDAVAAQYWVDRFACPGNAVMAAELGAQNISAMFASGKATIGVLAKQLLGAHIFGYVGLAAIHPYPMSSWMPVREFTTGDGLVGFALTYAVWIAPSLLAAASVVSYLCRKGWRGLLDPRVFLAGTLLAITSAWALSQVTRNVYEASHMLPAWGMALLFVLALKPAPTRLSSATLRKMATVMLVFAALTQVIVIGRMSGPLWAAAHDPGRLPLQQYSFSLADYPAVRADIRRAMQQAGMNPSGAQGGTGPDRRLNRLLIDDTTYLALQRSYLPIHALGVMGPWNGPIDDPAAFLASRNSDGIVATCASLWQAAADVAARSGEICAVNRQQLQRLAGGRPFVPADHTAPIPLADGAYPPRRRRD